MKIARAQSKLDALRSEALAYLQAPHVTAHAERDGEWDVLIADVAPLPAAWTLDVAEIAYHLRSALDQAVCAAMRRDGNDPARNSAFPVSPSRRWYERPMRGGLSRADVATAGVSSAVRQIIDDAQPYLVADPDRHPLAVIAELCNSDKHDVLIPIVTASRGLSIPIGRQGNAQVFIEVEWHPHVVGDGDELVRRAHHKDLPLYLADGRFEIGFTTRAEIIVSMAEIQAGADRVRDVVAAMHAVS